jgi:hypothetical protein
MDAIYSWAAIERPEAYAAAWRKIRLHLKTANRRLKQLEALHGPIPF